MFKPKPLKSVLLAIGFKLLYSLRTIARGTFERTYGSKGTAVGTLKASRATRVAAVLLFATTIITSGAILIAKPGQAGATTSSYLNFQARLETSTGSIVPDGNYNVEFKLYDTSTVSGTPDQGACTYNGGTADTHCLWLETRTGADQVRVANGYLTVNLGSVTAFGSINWDQQLYLTMRIGGTGAPSWDSEMTPRITLTAVPYAFQANSATQLQGNVGGSTGTLQFDSTLTGNQTFVLPDQGAANTYHLLTSEQANGDYIQLQSGTPGSAQSGNFNIGTGTGIAGTFDSVASGTLNLGTSNASTINIGTNVAAHTIAIGNGAAIQGITIGSTNSTSSLLLQAGTGNLQIQTQGGTLGIGNNAVAQTITIGNTTGTTGLTLTAGSNGIALQAATSVSANLTVTNAGNVAFQKGTDYSSTGTQTDVNFGTGVLIRLTGASALTIDSIANGVDGRMLTLVNASSNAETIRDQTTSTTGTAANKIITGTGSNITLAVDASISLVYDSGSSRWRVVGSAAATGSGTPWLQGGNNFGVGVQGVLGTTDSTSSLSFITGNSSRIVIDTSATTNFTFQQASNLLVGSAASGRQLTVQGGAATGAGNVGGTLLLQGGAGGSGAASGSVIVKSNASNSTTAFAVQDFNGGQVLGVDTTNNAVVVGKDGSPTAVTIRGGAASGNDTQGANLTIDASNGTGAAGSGDIIFRTAGAGSNAVTYDNSGKADDGGGAQVPSVTLSNFTVGSNSNRLLIVSVTTNGGSLNATSGVTWNGSNLTFLDSGTCPTINFSPSCRLEVWYMIAPATGTHNVVATLASGNGRISLVATSYYSVNQTTPLGTQSKNTGSTSPTSNSVTSTISQLVYDTVASDNTVSGTTVTGSNVRQTDNQVVMNAVQDKANLSGSNSFGWTSGSADWAELGVPINPVASSTVDTLQDRLHITATGNVGIDTSSPQYALDVTGTIQASTSVLTSLIDAKTSGGTLGVGTTNATTLNIGNSTAATVVTIQGGSTSSAVSVQAGSGGTISIGTSNNNTITIGSAQVAGTIAIGGTAGTGNITVGSSTASQSVRIANGSGAPTVTIANTSTAGATVTIAGAATATTKTDTVNIATGNTAGTGAKVVHIADGTPAGTGTNTVTIGSLTNASTTAIQGGTGATAISIQSGAAGTIGIGTNNTANTIQIGSTTLSSGTQTINIGNNNTAGGTTNVVIGDGSSATGGTVTLQAKGTAGTAIVLSANGTNVATFDTSSHLYLGNGISTGSPNNFTIQGTGSTTTAVAGGSITIQGGNATVGNANGGSLTLSGGAGVGTGAMGSVVITTPTVQTASLQTCSADCSITPSNVDSNGAVIVKSTGTGVTVTLNDPTITTAGKVVYVTAGNGSNDFTLSVNGGGTGNTIAMRQNTTATMIWNGSDWTAAGASSSTTLQSAYDNTLTSAGGAELILSNTSNHNGLTIRDSLTSPVGTTGSGTLLEVQTAQASNIFAVNSNVTDYANNGGAESTFGSEWAAQGIGVTVTQNSSSTYIADGIGSVKVVTGANANTGVKNVLTTTLTANLRYNVSFAAKLDSSSNSLTDLEVDYSKDGTSTTACSNYSTQSVKTSVWTKITCTFTAPSSGITSSNALFIRQTGATSHTWYVDNLSVTISADLSYATDGGVDDNTNFSTNWPALGSATITRDTSTGNDTSDSAKVVTTAGTNQGVKNVLSINPLNSTLYRISVYALLNSGTFTDFSVGYSPDDGGVGGTNFKACVDYNTQTITTTGWTQITCYVTTGTATVSAPRIYFYQPTATARTFWVDTFSMTLASNAVPNVQIGGGVYGGPTTLLTLDRAASAPIAANNDALLGSMYYDTTLGKLQCYEADGWGACGSSPDNIITLSPEYTNAVLHGTGVGTMTSDFCSDFLDINDATHGTAVCGTNETYNFYRWTSPQATSQTYSIYVTYQLPDTFKAFTSGSTSIMGKTDSSNSSVQYSVYKNSGTGAGMTLCGTVSVSSGVQTSWQTGVASGTADPSTCGFSAGDSIIFKIDTAASSDANAYVGNIGFTFSNK